MWKNLPEKELHPLKRFVFIYVVVQSEKNSLETERNSEQYEYSVT
jgi:hypothetical protein